MYSKDISIPDISCMNSVFIDNIDYERLPIEFVLVNTDLYHDVPYLRISFKCEDGCYSSGEYFYISLTEPIFMQEPCRELTIEEKTIINNEIHKHWDDRIFKIFSLSCGNCYRSNPDTCCNGFEERLKILFDKEIPDYTKLQ